MVSSRAERGLGRFLHLPHPRYKYFGAGCIILRVTPPPLATIVVAVAADIAARRAGRRVR
ncbi:hypothetical protein BRD56_04980 [Thermoplasmatales archaeon SW_10_69_26]|nr:MAG: hypothetical protein BRD56_04980 [Thermoplasmatales archaeon SW_10_69_26]